MSLSGSGATYFAAERFIGIDSFSFAALDGETDSNLGTVSVNVASGDCVLAARPTVPRAVRPNSIVSFHANAALSKCEGVTEFDWDFGDGSVHASESAACHA